VLLTRISLTGKLAVRVSLPYISGKYLGRNGHTLIRGQPETAVALDNGNFHGSLQDFRFDVRYSLSQRALKVVPFFQATIPSHDYPTLGHAAVGINVREYRVGVNLGRRLDPILPNAFVQGRYAFGFSQEVAHIAPKRSYAEFQLGYFLTRRLSLQGAAVLTYSHNGIDHDYNLFPTSPTNERLNHDRSAGRCWTRRQHGIPFNRSTNVFVRGGHRSGEQTPFASRGCVSGVCEGFATKLASEGHPRRCVASPAIRR
jgi:hypothetical protein